MAIEINVIIPARIGSKRIPKKNIKELHGKPIILHTIETIKESEIFSEIYVSTDSVEIQSMVVSNGVRCDKLRPENLADDFTPILDVMKYEIRTNPKIFKPNSVLACVFPTSVLLKSTDYISALEHFCNGSMKNFLISGAKYPHPPQRALIRNSSGGFKLVDPAMKFIRTQDLPEHFYDLGQFYFALTNTWLEADDVFNNCDCYLMSPNQVIDIDNFSDFQSLEERTRKSN